MGSEAIHSGFYGFDPVVGVGGLLLPRADQPDARRRFHTDADDAGGVARE